MFYLESSGGIDSFLMFEFRKYETKLDKISHSKPILRTEGKYNLFWSILVSYILYFL